jgi:hypothetical protein
VAGAPHGDPLSVRGGDRSHPHCSLHTRLDSETGTCLCDAPIIIIIFIIIIIIIIMLMMMIIIIIVIIIIIT